MVHFGEFLKTVLPDRSGLIGQKLIENAKIEMAKTRQIDHLWHFLMNFFSFKM